MSGVGGDELFAGYPWRYYRASQSQNFEDFIDNYYIYWHRLFLNSPAKAFKTHVGQENKVCSCILNGISTYATNTRNSVC